ncbi:MAG: carbohydrate binding family 9 domain-containing protein [Acidobacteria bacterium]|nr:carbohydrate binding family 9 domain-containing protein [Acidobacteriota bacterium]MBI3486546.1 carbohydrate binding family 9 domain-containing protein [Acidobacteriota bacterium]
MAPSLFRTPRHLPSRLKQFPLLALTAVLWAGFPATAAGEARKTLLAVRASYPLLIDGRLDEPQWALAPAATGFTVSSPELGKAPANQTEVWVLYDDHFVYIAARMHHPKGKAAIVRQIHRRDQDSASDWFGVYLDSLHDRRTAFAFMVNASGVQQDRLVYGDTNEDLSWDSVWESAVTTDADGWTAEMKIPLSVLRLKATQGEQVWGINFIRSDYSPRQELSMWQIVPRGLNAWVSHFPDLLGIKGVKPHPRREWVPYLSLQRKFETAQSFDDRRWKAQAGLDAHLGLNSYSQLDLTARPDFGQVEVDQAVLNLGTTETYFPEKRPFFLEGLDIFQFTGLDLFYSRRLGKGLSDPGLQPGEKLVDRPSSVDILGAAKYTSKFANGMNLGLLAANMEAARATVQDGAGQETRRSLEPMTHAMALRATQNVDERGSFIGGFASYLRQADPASREALVGGADWLFKPADRSGSLGLSFAHSSAGPRTGRRAGSFVQVQGNQQWKNGWSLNGRLSSTSRGFDPNDLGYNQRPDIQTLNAGATRRWDEPLGALRNRQWVAGYTVSRDLAGRVIDHFLGNWVGAESAGGWSAELGLEKSLAAYDDRELRTFQDPVKKYLRYSAFPRAFFNLYSPWGPYAASLRTVHHRREGGPTQSAAVFQSLRPTPNLEVSWVTTLAREEGQWHYLETQGAMPIVGMRRLGQLDQTLRISYGFSPVLTMQCFSQWMDAAWSFRDLRSYVNDHQLAPGASSAKTAFSDRLWNINLIARWEFLPGSALFAVYTHGTSTDALTGDRGGIRPLADLSRLRHLPSDDALQVKLSWLFR